MKVALLGSTSHIAKNLIKQNAECKKWELDLYARNTAKTQDFLITNNFSNVLNAFSLDKFQSTSVNYNAIINCIGFGTPEKIDKSGFGVFNQTELYDNKIIEYLENNNGTTLVNFSSGAVYGLDIQEPIHASYISTLHLCPINRNEHYRIVKIYSEAKHRSLKHLNIVDLRLFSFFSRYIELNSGFLLTSIVWAIQNGQDFQTNRSEIFRDYIHPYDLYNLIDCCMSDQKRNIAIDVYSAGCISKTELLSFVSRRYGLSIKYVDSIFSSPTGSKKCYYSNNKDAETLFGFRPLKKSLQTIREELDAILNQNG